VFPREVQLSTRVAHPIQVSIGLSQARDVETEIAGIARAVRVEVGTFAGR